MAWPEQRVIVEFDGEVHRDRHVFVRDLRRQNEIVLAGWRILRFSSADVLGRPRSVLRSVGGALGLN
jgi:very-short-patch-repair endonuclease